MPAVSVRKRLLRNAAQYAQRLLLWRRKRELLDLEDIDLADTDSTSIASDHLDSDATSLESTPSIASSNGSGYAADTDDFLQSLQEEEEETARYTAHMRALREHVEYLTSTRVLFPNTVDKREQLSLVLTKYKFNNADRFRRNLRVSPVTFDQLVGKIQHHEVFVGGERHASQTPVEEQLAIALFRFGHFGNAASVESIAQWAGTSAGMVVNATRRVIIAFLSLHDEAIRWPTAREKEDAKRWVEEASCKAWRGGWLLVDGTLVPLSDKPGHHGEAYFDRKSNYSLNVQLITLPNLRIIDYVLGPTGSMHDSSAFRESRTFKDHGALIGPDEWIWADSAYSLLFWCIAPYKKPASLQRDNKIFNYHVSAVRIRSEHAVGFLKGRFQSLRGLRQQIKNEQDHLRALEWIRTCIIIHTLVQDIESGTSEHDSDWDQELIQAGEDSSSTDSDSAALAAVRGGQRETQGQRKRRKLKSALFASGVSNRPRRRRRTE